MIQKSPFLTTALIAAKKAEVRILKHYSTGARVTVKQDQTPVTLADQEAEKIIIKEIKQVFPNHSVLGEESGTSDKESQYLWVIDPMDGTKNYLRKIPLFATQISLLKGNEVILGVSNAPALRELMYAEKNYGAYLNGEKIAVSSIDDLGEAYLSYGGLNLFDQRKMIEPLIRLNHDTSGHRGFGDFWSYHLLAQGKIDIMIEADTKIWDVAALSCIVEEAGGIVTDIFGKPVTRATTSIIATNGSLHKKVLAYFNS